MAGWTTENIDYWLKREPDKTVKIRNISPLHLPFGLYTELGWMEDRKEFHVIKNGVIGRGKPYLRTIYFRIFRELRWFAKERTFLIIRRDLFGRKKVEMIYRFKDRDTIKVGQYKKTIMTQRNTSTAWLYVERGYRGRPLHDYLLEGPRLQILKVRDFLVESVANQQSSDENYDGESWVIGWDELDCEPFIYGGGHGTGYGNRVDYRVQEGFK